MLRYAMKVRYGDAAQRQWGFWPAAAMGQEAYFRRRCKSQIFPTWLFAYFTTSGLRSRSRQSLAVIHGEDGCASTSMQFDVKRHAATLSAFRCSVAISTSWVAQVRGADNKFLHEIARICPIKSKMFRDSRAVFVAKHRKIIRTTVFGRQGPEVRILSLRPIEQGTFGCLCHLVPWSPGCTRVLGQAQPTCRNGSHDELCAVLVRQFGHQASKLGDLFFGIDRQKLPLDFKHEWCEVVVDCLARARQAQ